MSFGAANYTYDLPENVPTGTRCIQIQIPDDPEYYRLLTGALGSLSDWYNYDRDATKKGRLVARLWRKALASIQFCPTPVNNVLSPCDDCGCGGCMTVRFNGCVLEQYDCTTQMWVAVPTVNGPCISNPAPGANAPPTPPGHCNTYALSVDARLVTPLPFNVSTGDTIQLIEALGAATDGGGGWFCPDGEVFLLGACAGGGTLVGTDPLPTHNHMSLLLKIGSSFFPLSTTLFTVPGGVTNQPVYIQENDSSLTDDGGIISVKLNYCNNATPPPTSWCQLLDFTLSPQGMTGETNEGIVVCGGTDNGTIGVWTAGVGWSGTIEEQADCVHHFSILRLYLLFGAPVVFTAEIKGTISNTDSSSQLVVNGVSSVNPAAGGSNAINIAPIPNGAFDYTGTTSASKPYLDIFCLMQNSSNGPTPSSVISSIKLTGTGVNPFGSSNC